MAAYAYRDSLEYCASPTSDSLLLTVTHGLVEQHFKEQEDGMRTKIDNCKFDSFGGFSFKKLQKIRNLLAHTTTISALLQDQLEVLESYERSSNWEAQAKDLNLGHLICCTPSAIMNRALLGRLVRTVHRQIGKNKRNAAALEREIVKAEQVIQWRSDQNNTVTFVFTVITTIFLPLSVITGYFGMNTYDIRDMDEGVGTFWASAVGLTAFFGFLSFMLARHWRVEVFKTTGHVDRFKEGVGNWYVWIAGLWKRRDSAEKGNTPREGIKK
ncbi:hypothetical protein BJ508DRAFT_417182 [Ascobolus immersus RN42]|uniref:Cora-domain-containing protein n=1 Tax=Ascobolus immersus RN42 TaxID=1160509 RepID=A0A3N4HTT3_ASCIM|nr:hypothetical protein BJ508DRAFT_417182 [Ascobolus immersus RN42]